ncbi:MAG: gamma-glutamyl-gamma-aminobutyrate hydrolase family protein [Pirellulaceae bacterium]|nr:gamma-glutamyl-gamma-aminobutyrate hydrolase family protein [Pirellulaceae bacterium]
MSATDKPVVGLNLICRCDHFVCSCFGEPVLQCWVKFLEDADAIPFLLVPLERSDDVMRQVNHLDAVVYVGWRDLDPSIEASGPEAVDHDPEVRLLRMIADRQKPFLGIGRGVQLLNVALGGTLRPVLHGRGPCQRHVHPHNPQHPLETLPGSLLAQVYSQPSELVNSMHEYAVDEPAVGFRVTARGPASVVEAIESESDDWLAVGVQFPPSPRAADLDLRLLGAFLNRFRSGAPQPAYEDSACR